MPDFEKAIVDHLRVGQERSLVEIGVELAIPYGDLQSAVDQLVGSGKLEEVRDDDTSLYRLNHDALNALHTPADTATVS